MTIPKSPECPNQEVCSLFYFVFGPGGGVLSNTWVVVKMMVPFWIPVKIRHLIFRVPPPLAAELVEHLRHCRTRVPGTKLGAACLSPTWAKCLPLQRQTQRHLARDRLLPRRRPCRSRHRSPAPRSRRRLAGHSGRSGAGPRARSACRSCCNHCPARGPKRTASLLWMRRL